MVKHVLLCGCGNIGFRHLQALATIDTPAQITIVEPFTRGHGRIADFIASEASGGPERYSLLDALPEARTRFDLVVIATSADTRQAAFEAIVDHHDVGCILFEKILFQSIAALEAVGARLARDAGMVVELAGSAGLQAVIDQLAGEQHHLLRLAGETHLPLKLPEKLTMASCITYRTHYQPLTEKQAALLANGANILLHSGEMAEHFGAQCDTAGLDRGLFSCAAMAPRIAERAGEGWGSLVVAKDSSDAALLAVAKDLCEKG